MSTNKKISALVGVASLAVIGTAIYCTYSRRKNRKKLEQSERVSDEGYEFAADILFPIKRHPLRRYF